MNRTYLHTPTFSSQTVRSQEFVKHTLSFRFNSSRHNSRGSHEPSKSTGRATSLHTDPPQDLPTNNCEQLGDEGQFAYTYIVARYQNPTGKIEMIMVLDKESGEPVAYGPPCSWDEGVAEKVVNKEYVVERKLINGINGIAVPEDDLQPEKTVCSHVSTTTVVQEKSKCDSENTVEHRSVRTVSIVRATSDETLGGEIFQTLSRQNALLREEKKSALNSVPEVEEHETFERKEKDEKKLDMSNSENSIPSIISVVETKALHTKLDEEKCSHSKFTSGVKHSVWAERGSRASMEDCHYVDEHFGNICERDSHLYFGVYDGHSGSETAQYCKEHLHTNIASNTGCDVDICESMTKGFLQTDDDLKTVCEQTSCESGSTGLVMILNVKELYVACAGDSRAVLCRGGEAIDLTKDHTPANESEKFRIAEEGGMIDELNYLGGRLAVSRAFGDFCLDDETGERRKITGLTAVPEVKKHYLVKEDEFLIAACDGLWDVFTSEQAVKFTRRRLRSHNDIEKVSEDLVKIALSRGSTDNITVLVVGFGVLDPKTSKHIFVTKIQAANVAERPTGRRPRFINSKKSTRPRFINSKMSGRPRFFNSKQKPPQQDEKSQN